MGEPTPATPASKYFAATVAMIAGAFFFAVGAGLLPIPGGPSNLHGPLWLMLCVGLAFFLAGVAIIIQLLGRANDNGDLPPGTPLWLRAVQYLIGLCIFVYFGAISSWIALQSGGSPSAPVRSSSGCVRQRSPPSVHDTTRAG